MTQVADEKDLYLSNYERVDKPAADPPWLARVRKAAIATFAEIGFPTKRDEAWQFTNVAPIARVPFQPAEYTTEGLTPHGITRLTFHAAGAHQFVFVNGRHSPELSSDTPLPRGVELISLAEALLRQPERLEKHLARHARHDTNGFVALNISFIADGAVLWLKKGTILEQPIHLVFVSVPGDEPTVSHPRVLVVAEDGVHASIVESYAGSGEGVYFTNAVTELIAGENCLIEHCKLQRENTDAFHVAMMHVHLGRATNFFTHSIAFGGQLVRNDVYAVLDGEGIEATVNGLYLGNDRQHVDNYTTLDHAKPHCASHELYKGVLYDRASAAFRGRIIVREGAQKTDAKQTNRTLLMSDDAVINTKPQLEIYADDVKCTHGATVGQLDREMIFYLRSRGIDEESARNVLTYAFADSVIRRVRLAPVRAHLEEVMLTRQNLPRELRAEEEAD